LAIDDATNAHKVGLLEIISGAQVVEAGPEASQDKCNARVGSGQLSIPFVEFDIFHIHGFALDIGPNCKHKIVR